MLQPNNEIQLTGSSAYLDKYQPFDYFVEGIKYTIPLYLLQGVNQAISALEVGSP